MRFYYCKASETVALRSSGTLENASKVAEFLRDQSAVESVNFAGFTDSPYYPLVQKYLRGKACSLMTFEIRAASKPACAFYNALKLFQASGEFGRCEVARLPSGLDDAPANDVGRAAGAGVAPGGIRLSAESSTSTTPRRPRPGARPVRRLGRAP